MNGTENQAQTEITLVYFRYWGEKDENNHWIYERQSIEGITSVEEAVKHETYFKNHSEVKNHFIWIAGEGWDLYDEGDMIVEWKENAN